MTWKVRWESIQDMFEAEYERDDSIKPMKRADSQIVSILYTLLYTHVPGIDLQHLYEAPRFGEISGKSVFFLNS